MIMPACIMYVLMLIKIVTYILFKS